MSARERLPSARSGSEAVPRTSDAVLRLDGVSKSYGPKPALDAVSLAIAGDEYVALLGASGSGKTVLLRAIAGFEHPDSGTISLNGRPVNGVPAHERHIGFVFQNFALFPHLTVGQNVAFGLANRKGDRPMSAAAIDRKVGDMIALVGLAGLEDRGVHQISGGQRQRVALARTLVTEPRLVLLDEPLGALDANLRARMCGELRRIRSQLGVTFLHVTGSETEALAMGDRVVVLDAGRVAQFDPPDVVYNRPANARVARFLNCYNLLAEPPGDRGSTASGSGRTTYAVRQDLITVRPADTGAGEGETRLAAAFITSENSGPGATYFFRAPGGEIVTVEHHFSHHEPQTFEPERTYQLVWNAEDALILPGHPGGLS